MEYRTPPSSVVEGKLNAIVRGLGVRLLLGAIMRRCFLRHTGLGRMSTPPEAGSMQEAFAAHYSAERILQHVREFQ